MFNNHANHAIDNILKRFWDAMSTFKGTGYQHYSQLRYLSSIDVIDSMRFMLNVDWPHAARVHLPQLRMFIELLENLQLTQQLMEAPMSDENERRMRLMQIYFGNVRILQRQQDACVHLGFCVNFFINIYAASRIPFTPVNLTISTSYAIKDQIRYVQKNSLMPSMSDFISGLAFLRNGFRQNSFSQFYSLELVIVPTHPMLADIFLNFLAHPIVVNRLALHANNELLNYPTLAAVPLNRINQLMAFLDETQRHRIIISPIIARHAPIFDSLIKVMQYRLRVFRN